MRVYLFVLSVLLTVGLIGCSNSFNFSNSSDQKILDEESSSPYQALTGPVGTNHPASGSYSPVSESTWSSATWPKGSRYVTSSVAGYYDLEIGVYAPNAQKVLLELYSAATGVDAEYDYWMAKGSDGIWRAKLKQAADKKLYAFRVWGANTWAFSTSWTRGNSAVGFIADVDAFGNRFNPNKVLYDPYAKELSHDTETPAMITAGFNGNLYATGPALYKSVPRRNWDSAKWAPKSVALRADTTSFGTKPKILQKDAIVYEAHLKGLTADNSVTTLTSILSGISGFESVVNVPTAYKGTYKGAGYMAKYLKALGINTIELLPVHESANDNNPTTQSGGNFWGYMTYGYFAPDRKFSYDKTLGGPTKEFKAMVKAFHDNGIEVWLDVVYNHTGEGGTWEDANTVQLVSFLGLAPTAYYRLTGASNQYLYSGTTGCGNQVNAANAASKALILDSLTYWADSLGVDGFRFDLAYTLGRVPTGYGYNSNAQTLVDIQALGTAKNVEMIAEAWDCEGAGVSSFPGAWGDWNGDYRDVVRKFITGNGYKPGTYYNFGDVFYGTYNGYNDNGGPHKSVNFIVAHDGFTLADLVSYNTKLNTQAWPWGPSDGGNDNNSSWDHGGNQALRRQQLRNLFAIQMFSRGVPMIVYGDEFARSQNGNNNPYNLDSQATWNVYSMINRDAPQTVISGAHNNIGTDGKADSKNNIFLFSKYVMNLRAGHPALRQADYSMSINIKKEDGVSTLSDTDRCVWIRMDGSAKADEDFLLFINSYSADVGFKVPAPDTGKKWVRIIDTANWAEANNNYWDVATGWSPAANEIYNVQARTVVVFQQAPVTVVTTTTTTTTTVVSNITLKMTKDVGSGYSIFFSGSPASLTSWGTGVQGTWTTGNVWQLTIANPGTFEWKVRKGVTGGTGNTWETGTNHNQSNLWPAFNGGF